MQRGKWGFVVKLHKWDSGTYVQVVNYVYQALEISNKPKIILQSLMESK